MSACPIKECPICMDDILEVNLVITECGHNFHTSCLMKNAAHNGFGCPYCRTIMAEIPEDEEDELEEDDDDDDESSVIDEEESPFSNYSLRGMRWLFQRSNNEEIEEEEEEEEDAYPAPTSELVAQKLAEQNITFHDIVTCLLAINHQEYEDIDEYHTKEDEVFDKIQVIIGNFRNPQPYIRVREQEGEEEVQVQVQVHDPIIEEVLENEEEKIEIEINSLNKIDFSAQPKERRNNRNNTIVV